MDCKWYAALAYMRANRLNHNVIEGPNDRYGIIASGKANNDLRQALHDLGLDDDTCRHLGIRVHKVAVVWPLEAQTTRAFAEGLREILVVEEKRQVIECQLKEELYNWCPDVRPDVLGKFDEIEGDHTGGEWSEPKPSAHTLLRANADLTPALIARALARRLTRLGMVPEGSDLAARVPQRLALIEAREQALQAIELHTGQAQRLPWFCSGCPHNTSTRVPEGARAMAGLGCHCMAIWMNRQTVAFTPMGGEGVPWVGQQPFTHEKHLFANLGDGTYFHSGLLAIRQAIAAGVHITYKILYNEAVAMTGGQPVGERPEGHSVLQIVHSLRAEGVRKLFIVTDEPAKYDGAHHVTPGGVVLTLPADVHNATRRWCAACNRPKASAVAVASWRARWLRGTRLDPFGYTEERRMERALIREYEQAIEALLAGLQPKRLPPALAIARWPEQVKGFGHVKLRHLQAARPRWDELRRRWRAGASHPDDEAAPPPAPPEAVARWTPWPARLRRRPYTLAPCGLGGLGACSGR